MTEYQPYGVRHFLRAADAEGVSELRYRPVPLRDGSELEKGEWGDADQISLPALLIYRTLVLRRNPAQSRPPSVYSLVRRGDYYDVWQRPAGATGAIAEHLPLGDFNEPGARPTCAEILRFARLAGPGGTVAAVERAPTVIVSLDASEHPASWVPTEPGSPDPRAGDREPRRGLGPARQVRVLSRGSVRGRLTLSVDGVEIGAVEEQLNESGQFLYLGQAPLAAGTHQVELALAGQTLAPGSGGPPEPIGPLVLSPAAAVDSSVLRLPATRAAELCGRRLDWVEALPRQEG